MDPFLDRMRLEQEEREEEIKRKEAEYDRYLQILLEE